MAVSREESEILRWFRYYASEDQKLRNQVSSLTEQVNTLGKNLNQSITHLHHKQHHLNTANQTLEAATQRMSELDQALNQSERSRAVCENELQNEKSAHETTKDYLAQEFAQHHRADDALNRQAKAMRNLSNFLMLIQGASDDDKEATVQALGKRDDMGTLIMELEDKKRALAELEDQREREHTQFESATKSLREHCLRNHQHPNLVQSCERDSPMPLRTTEEGAAGARRGKSRRLRAQRGHGEVEDHGAV